MTPTRAPRAKNPPRRAGPTNGYYWAHDAACEDGPQIVYVTDRGVVHLWDSKEYPLEDWVLICPIPDRVVDVAKLEATNDQAEKIIRMGGKAVAPRFPGERFAPSRDGAIQEFILAASEWIIARHPRSVEPIAHDGQPAKRGVESERESP